MEAINFFDKDIQKHKPISSIKLSNYNTKKHMLVASCIFHFFSLSLLIEDIICFFPNTWNPIRFKFIFTYCVPLFACNTFILELNILLSLLTIRYGWINEELLKLKSKFDIHLQSENSNIHKISVIGYGYGFKNINM